MTALNLSSLLFRAGPKPADPALRISPTTVTVLVGPNNSGKSLALREIEQWCVGNDQQRIVVDSIEASFLSAPVQN